MRVTSISTVLLTIALAIAGSVAARDDYNQSDSIMCYECSEPNPCTTFTGDENYNFGAPKNCTGTDYCVKTEDKGRCMWGCVG